MEKHKLILNHTHNLSFETDINGYPLILNAAKTEDGKVAGITPKKLLLAGLTGCTGIDVVGMLETMRVPFSDFTVEVESNLTDEHPKVYASYHLVYTIKVKPEHQDKVKRAVSLSKEKYCGVSAMLAKAAPLTYEILFL